MENLVKNKLNIIGTGYVKETKFGEIVSFLPDVPIKANLCDLLFILTVPDQKNYSQCYCRLQDKSKMTYDPKLIEGNFIDEKDFVEIKEMGFLKEKDNLMLICAPKSNVVVSLDKLVVIAAIPAEGNKAPFYFKKKVYEINKNELKQKEENLNLDEEYLVRDNKFEINLENLPF